MTETDLKLLTDAIDHYILVLLESTKDCTKEDVSTIKTACLRLETLKLKLKPMDIEAELKNMLGDSKRLLTGMSKEIVLTGRARAAQVYRQAQLKKQQNDTNQ